MECFQAVVFASIVTQRAASRNFQVTSYFGRLRVLALTLIDDDEDDMVTCSGLWQSRYAASLATCSLIPSSDCEVRDS